MSTKTQVSWSPIALCTRAAATAESTPPDRPQITRSVADLAPGSASTGCSMIDVIVQVGRAAAHVVEEVLEDLLAVRRVHHLGVELHAVDPPLGVLEGGDGRVAGVEP